MCEKPPPEESNPPFKDRKIRGGYRDPNRQEQECQDHSDAALRRVQVL